MSKKSKAPKHQQSTREFLDINAITGHSVETTHGELVYFLIKPTNLSTLSGSSIHARIYALMTVLKGFSDVELMCLNSRENFENNKQFLTRRLAEEHIPAIRQLLQEDLTNLDRIQVSMATAREFLVVVRLRGEKEADALLYLSRIEKSLKDQGFTSRRADEQDIKRLLAVYFEQNVTTERFENTDGERWVIFND